MAGRGPAPAPAEIRLLKGNGKDLDVAGRKVGRQPRTVASIPPVPDGLAPDAAFMWEHVTPEMERMGILGQVDLAALEAYCRLYDEMHNHPGGRGFPQVALALLRLATELGLTPAGRLRMTLPEPVDNDESRAFAQR